MPTLFAEVHQAASYWFDHTQNDAHCPYQMRGNFRFDRHECRSDFHNTDTSTEAAMLSKSLRIQSRRGPIVSCPPPRSQYRRACIAAPASNPGGTEDPATNVYSLASKPDIVDLACRLPIHPSRFERARRIDRQDSCCLAVSAVCCC